METAFSIPGNTVTTAEVDALLAADLLEVTGECPLWLMRTALERFLETVEEAREPSLKSRRFAVVRYMDGDLTVRCWHRRGTRLVEGDAVFTIGASEQAQTRNWQECDRESIARVLRGRIAMLPAETGLRRSERRTLKENIMAIEGLTDGKPTLPRVGTLRKGAARDPGKNRPGKDLTYFRFVTTDPDLPAKFEEAYGKEPRRINAYLMHATALDNFDPFREFWQAGGLRHRCTGKTMVLWRENGGEFSQEPKPCPYAHLPARERLCKPVGRLPILIPELERFAVVTVLTSSSNDCHMLSANLAALEALHKDLRGIPFILHRRPFEVPTPREGKSVRTTKWLLVLEVDPRWGIRKLGAMEQLALPPAIVAEDEEDDNDVIDVPFETAETPKKKTATSKAAHATDVEPPGFAEDDPPAPKATNGTNGLAAKMERIVNLAAGKKVEDVNALCQREHGKGVAELTAEEAGEFILFLQKLPAAGAATAREALGAGSKKGKGKTDAPPPPPTAAGARVPEPLPPVDLNPRSEKQQALQDHLESLVGTGDTARFHSLKEAWVEVNALLKRKTANQWAAADARSIDDDLCDWLIPNLPPF